MVKNLPANAGYIRDVGLIPGFGRSLPGEPHGQRGLVVNGPQGHKESDAKHEWFKLPTEEPE